MKFDIKDFGKNPKKYIGKRVLVNSKLFSEGTFGDPNKGVANSKEIYIARATPGNILYLFKRPEGSTNGHTQAWNEKEDRSIWKNVYKFPYGEYASWNASEEYITDYFNNDMQLEFDFGNT